MTSPRPMTLPSVPRQGPRVARLLFWTAFLGFVGLNLLAYRHARAMMTYAQAGARTASPEHLQLPAKLKLLATGVTLPRPELTRTPADFGLECRTNHFPGAFTDTCII